jgi:hypothetical protein
MDAQSQPSVAKRNQGHVASHHEAELEKLPASRIT